MILILRASFVAAAATLVCLALAACSQGPAAPKRNHSAGGRRALARAGQSCRSFASCRAASPRPASPRCAPACPASSSAAISSKAATSRPGDVLYQLDRRALRNRAPRPRRRRLPRPTQCSTQEAADRQAQEALGRRAPSPQSQLRHRGRNLSPGRSRCRRAQGRCRTRQAQSRITPMIRAPISGRIGRALVTEGALVGQSDADACGDDPAARSDLCRFHPVGRRAATSFAASSIAAMLEAAAPTRARVRLILDNGEVYPHEGKLLFSDTTVDPGTGQVTLRGEFPESEAVAAARHVCPCADRAGHRSRCARGAAAGRPPQRHRRRAKCLSCATTTAPQSRQVRLGRASRRPLAHSRRRQAGRSRHRGRLPEIRRRRSGRSEALARRTAGGGLRARGRMRTRSVATR